MPQTETSRVDTHAFVKGFHGVRYQVKDVARSVTFYTEHLGFTLRHQQLPAFASLSLGDSQLLLSGPRSLRVAGAAGRPTARAWRLEPHGAESF